MRTITFIFVFIFSFNGFSQFEPNDLGADLSENLRTLDSRKNFIEKRYSLDSFLIHSIRNNYKGESIESTDFIDMTVDSFLISVLPVLHKTRYKISHDVTYNSYHIATSETIVIKKRFRTYKKKDLYIIYFDYYMVDGMMNKYPYISVNLPNTYN
jgi:hypothetical protein